MISNKPIVKKQHAFHQKKHHLKKKKYCILVSNDDGIYAEGLVALVTVLKKIADVWVVAPLEEKSTSGHSLTIHKPLRILEMKAQAYAVNGSPADCVYLGIREVLKRVPDMVISGINRGANMGQDVYYSGTVSAAREACILGIPAISVSLAVDFRKAYQKGIVHHYESAAKVIRLLLKRFELFCPPKHTLLNVNVPDRPFSKLKGFQWTSQGFRFYSGSVLKRKDHRGRSYYWVGGQYSGFRSGAETDCDVVDHGWVSVTPLMLDATNRVFLNGKKKMFLEKKITLGNKKK